MRRLLITHEEVQEKPYKLEMSWLTEETGWTHKRVSEDLMCVGSVENCSGTTGVVDSRLWLPARVSAPLHKSGPRRAWRRMTIRPRMTTHQTTMVTRT